MADDIDNLLEEAEKDLKLDAAKPPIPTEDKKLHNEVNEMLGLDAKDEQEIPKAISDKQIASSFGGSSKLANGTTAKKKCHPLVLTGTYSSAGESDFVLYYVQSLD